MTRTDEATRQITVLFRRGNYAVPFSCEHQHRSLSAALRCARYYERHYERDRAWWQPGTAEVRVTDPDDGSVTVYSPRGQVLDYIPLDHTPDDEEARS